MRKVKKRRRRSRRGSSSRSSDTLTEASPRSYDLRSLPSYLRSYFERINQNALRRLSSVGLAPRDLPSLAELANQGWPRDVVVLSRGPSFFRQDYLSPILEARTRGAEFAVVAVDGCLAPCLKVGLVPDLVCTVDPHEYRILRWFGDREGISDRDDYFRLDRDTPRNPRALMAREEVVQLTERYGPRLKVACGIYTSGLVIQRLREIGARVYQFIPMHEDSEELVRQLRLPAIYTGGNVGTAAYSIAVSILGAKRIALAGFDFSYPPGTPLEQTQYYDVLESQGRREMAERFFVKIRNPHLREEWFTDLVYLMYADEFVWTAQLAAQQGVETCNCTQGGIIYGDAIKWMSLEEFLRNTR